MNTVTAKDCVQLLAGFYMRLEKNKIPEKVGERCCIIHNFVI